MTPGVALPRIPNSLATPATDLPAWPLAALFVGFPIWWLLGIGDVSWTIAGAVMAYYIFESKQRYVPKGFGLVLAFLLWAGLSVIAIDTASRLLGFFFRYAQYVAIAVIFVYIYNARRSLPVVRILGYLSVFWCWMILGGYLGILFPTAVIKTPLAAVLPSGLLSNDLVQRMVVLRLTQGFNPDAWIPGDPRPSAPFLFTNNWGNAYSLLLPLVLLYISIMPRGWRRWLLVLAVPISMVPAFLTLNRGMFLGLAVVAVVVVARFALQGKFKPVAALVGVCVLGLIVASQLPFLDRLDDRLDTSGTNVARVSVYAETIERTLAAPIFGYGAPRPADTSSVLPPAGTQGQVWMVMFSHGFVGVGLFLAILLWFAWRALRLRSSVGVVISGILVAFFVEVFYYGVLGAGLCVIFITAAIAMRESLVDAKLPALKKEVSG